MHSIYFSFIIVMIAILNPIGNAAIFVSLTTDFSPESTQREVYKATMAIGLILLFSIWVGDLFLRFFGISVSAFSISGGFIVFLIGLNMINTKSYTHNCADRQTYSDIKTQTSIAIVPLNIPIIAGPGAISTIIMHARNFPTLLERGLESLIVIGLALMLALCTTCSQIVWWSGAQSHYKNHGVGIVCNGSANDVKRDTKA